MPKGIRAWGSHRGVAEGWIDTELNRILTMVSIVTS